MDPDIIFGRSVRTHLETARYSDDGEPPGSAGLPVLSVLQSEGLRNVAIVVTRYFGGTLLGTGGLVRAYGRAAREAVDAAGIARMTRYLLYRLTAEYPASGKLEYAFGQLGIVVADIRYTDRVCYTLYVEGSQQETFLQTVREITAGNTRPEEENEVFGAFVGDRLIFPE